MRLVSLLSVPVVALSLALGPDASACGGCFHEPVVTESTQVVGHKMILSVSTSATTLWDQIAYSGNPSSFSWVLPIKGVVEVGLSSDALFESLVAETNVTIVAPPLNCPGPPFCGTGFSASASNGAGPSGSGGAGGGVTVIAQEVVGPYETVQLSSMDPNALYDWFTTHGYEVPMDIQPVISDYIAEGFDFLALKLVPGQGISAMKPVRVTTPGASPVLPLRMVAAGVGVSVPITLWVMGEGRYEPTNFPSFVIQDKDIVWDYATSSSNYAKLRQDGFAASMGKGWLIEMSRQATMFAISAPLADLVASSPATSGYGDAMGQGAQQALDDDLDKLFGGIAPSSLWVTRMAAELPRTALDVDLDIGASLDQSSVFETHFPAKANAINVPPCPVYPPCDNSSASSATGAGGAGGDGGAGGAPGTGGSKGDTASGGGCAVGAGEAGQTALAVLATLAGLALARRRPSFGPPGSGPRRRRA
jgi:hypothetical protein